MRTFGIWALVSWSILLFVGTAFANNDYSLESECHQNETKGMYLPWEDLQIRCCNEMMLPSPRVHWSIREECQTNVTRDNDNDDLPTLISKTEACIDNHNMGDEITFKKFVEYNLKGYTNESNVRQIILDANKECSEGDKETELFKKLEAYQWCLVKNEETVCDKPTNGTKALIIGVEKVKQTCPELPKGVSQSFYCCNGKSTRTLWQMWASPFRRMKQTESENECITLLRSILAINQKLQGSSNISDFLEQFIHSFPYFACSLNPVKFENGTLGPEISWNFEDSFKKYINGLNLNKKMLTDISDRSLKLKPTLKLSVRYNDMRNKTGKTFEEIEQMYNEATDLYSRVSLYCIYYQKIAFLPKMAFYQYCGVESRGSLI